MSFPLQPPEAVIEPSEDAASIGAALLEAIVGLLTGGERKTTD